MADIFSSNVEVNKKAIWIAPRGYYFYLSKIWQAGKRLYLFLEKREKDVTGKKRGRRQLYFCWQK